MPEWLGDVAKALTITAASSAITGLIVQLKNRRKVEYRTQEALKKLLRSNIMAIHEVYFNRGYCPVHVKEILQESYDMYESLGGNGLGKKMFDETMKLPENPEESEQ